MTPQRLHAELLVASDDECRAYLYGALHDAHVSDKRRTIRFGQRYLEWHDLLEHLLDRLGHKSWRYREGKERNFWITETSAEWLRERKKFHSAEELRAYARGYFDAEGSIPRPEASRLYVQFVQKNLADLTELRNYLEEVQIRCGRIHNPSHRVDPDMWRFYILSTSHSEFLEAIGSWHPAKCSSVEGWRLRLGSRMKI